MAGLSTPLAAQAGGQTSALTGGLAFTVGGGWQVEAGEIGYAYVVRGGPLAVVSLTARLGSFIDEGAIIGGAQGFVVGATLAGRTPMLRIADVGADTGTSQLGLDLTLEVTGYAGAHTPLVVGSPWGGASLLPGLRYGSPTGGQLGVLFGPTLFVGQVTQVRPFLGIRFEAPLARRERHP